MNVPFLAFKKVNKEFSALSKFITNADIDFSYHYDSRYQPIFSTSYSQCKFKGIAEMYGFAKIKQIPYRTAKLVAFDTPAWWHELQRNADACTRTLDEIREETVQMVNTLKLVPESIHIDRRPKVFRNAPVEVLDGDYTYRIVTEITEKGMPVISLIARNDEPIYDYLDKGYYMKRIEYAKQNGDTVIYNVVANEYDLNTAHIFMMCTMQPDLSEMLKDGCFINSYEAEMLRLRMQKKMAAPLRNDYLLISKTIDDDYKKNTTILVVGKLMKGEVDRTVINNVTFTKNSATYDRVTIEADDLLEVLGRQMNFNSEFDIYTVTESYARYVEAKLTRERELMASAKPAGRKVEEPADNENEDNLADDAEEDMKAVLKDLPTFKINGIEITASVSNTYQRYLNKVRINKEEIAKAIHRASCHHNAADYKLFLKSICKMSIKWHDIIANGMPVKIHSTITRDEYNNDEPSIHAPALKFFIDKDEKCIKIVVSKDRAVKVSLAKIVRKVTALNKKTDNGWRSRRGWNDPYGNRNYEWCQHSLVEILVEASTFITKTVDAEGKPVETKTVLLTKDDIVKLLDVANEAKKAAIERSKQFLDTAVKLTNAEKVEFMGEQAYKIQGALRTYAVIIKNAKVYDFETKQYRCIVNDRHYAGAGYDDIAARLLALKNDSVMQENIRTLKGAAQPGAENAHNDYRPEREVDNHIAVVAEQALGAI